MSYNRTGRSRVTHEALYRRYDRLREAQELAPKLEALRQRAASGDAEARQQVEDYDTLRRWGRGPASAWQEAWMAGVYRRHEQTKRQARD